MGKISLWQVVKIWLPITWGLLKATFIVVLGGVWVLLLVTRVSGHWVQSLGQGTAPRRARTRPGPRARKEVGNEHTQSIRAELSGGRGKIGTKAGFWKEQELEWGVNRNRMGEGSPGTPAGGGGGKKPQTQPERFKAD